VPRSKLAAVTRAGFATAKVDANAPIKPGFVPVRIGQYYHFEIRATSDGSGFQAESARLEGVMAID
jgi:hypothetical protein